MWTTGAAAQALHGFCSGCVVDDTIGGTQVTSTMNNPPLSFGFWSAAMGGLSGVYSVDILTPDNGGAAPAGSYMISGGATGTASLFKTTAWTSGALDSYLGISAQPNNPLSAWLPATNTVDPKAMGYWVFQAPLGTHTLGTASGTGPVLRLGSFIPQGSVIVAFLDVGGTKTVVGTKGISATANSAALFAAGVPEPGTLGLLLLGLLGTAGSLLRRRRGSAHTSAHS
jgi:hypothetical protein